MKKTAFGTIRINNRRMYSRTIDLAPFSLFMNFDGTLGKVTTNLIRETFYRNFGLLCGNNNVLFFPLNKLEHKQIQNTGYE